MMRHHLCILHVEDGVPRGRDRAETPEGRPFGDLKPGMVEMTDWRGLICILEAESASLAVGGKEGGRRIRDGSHFLSLSTVMSNGSAIR